MLCVNPRVDHEPYTYIDLFCGCGGFSLGMQRAGFHEQAAIDCYPEAISTFRNNLRHLPNDQIVQADLTKFGPEQLDAMIMPANSRAARPIVDVIVGGPPCQGFSPVRRVDGGNHGTRLVADERRHLYKQFLAFVAYYQPRVFVMENVLGIRSAAGGEFFTRVQCEARALGYRVHGEELRAWRYGVPQKRIRQIIIGTRRGLLCTLARTDPPCLQSGRLGFAYFAEIFGPRYLRPPCEAPTFAEFRASLLWAYETGGPGIAYAVGGPASSLRGN
jgi:DNA-cytosine methyltransferase